MSDWEKREPQEEQYEIAIVGMNGRFPGAPNLHTFWQNLRDGVESITFFSDAELADMGVPADSLRSPNFVKAAPVLADIDKFDATFFGYTPREAKLLDPQHRLFLECAYAALEDAGYNPATYPGAVGVYAGTSLSTYLLFNLLTNPHLSDAEHNFEVMIGNDKDFLSTRVSYHLDLQGPSLDVQTGCSTSLVATHLASEALLSYQCDLALAGGVSIHVPQRTGYFYEEGGITSPDGHCRAFDAQAAGTLFGSGVGLVVLKRLEDALRDGDTIHAIIKSSAINNDGSRKVGYTAPGIDGQTEVITRAISLANVDPQTIGYVETHGTGTRLGDPIEITALTKAFHAHTDATQFCALGSVKSNIGHLDAAAGIASLLKTVLALKHKQIPPSLHFTDPNPKINFANSPFFVSTSLSDWSQQTAPRRAGVSSFGIGGTNAHLILEEAPITGEPPVDDSRRWQLLLLSARTKTALDTINDNLQHYVHQRGEQSLADVAYTLQIGRKRFPYRRFVLCRSRDDALEKLHDLPSSHVFTTHQEASSRPVVFMFPGGGAQYINMARDLYEREPIFQETVDRCMAILRPSLSCDLRDYLYPENAGQVDSTPDIESTSLALPALFTIEYATAKLLDSWGVQPAAMIGHSLGEYTAACLAGVFTLEDTLAVVVKRGQLFEQLPSGAMLSIPLSAGQLRPLLTSQLSFAAINSPGQCVVSGPVAAIEAFTDRLNERQIEYRRLKINVAAHSTMVDTIVPAFTQFVAQLPLQAPQVPFLSNVTGTWITAETATDPAYWGRQLRQTVHFQRGTAELLADPSYVFLEIGPGRSLSTLLKLQVNRSRTPEVLATIRHPYDRICDDAFLLHTLGKLWSIGVDVDWQGFHARQNRRRVSLPTYPFERQRYWIEPGTPHARAARAIQGKLPHIADWFYTPTWQRTPPRHLFQPAAFAGNKRCWLLFGNDSELDRELIALLQAAQQEVILVLPGSHFHASRHHEYVMRPGSRADYEALLRELHRHDQVPDYIIHLWSLADTADFPTAQERGFYSILHLVQALGVEENVAPLSLWILTRKLFHVESRDEVDPNRATLLGPCKVAPQEYDHISCYCVDLLLTPHEPGGTLSQQLLTDIVDPPTERLIAYRGRQRWVQNFTPYSIPADAASNWPLRTQGVYLITGGLGKIGLLLAGYLARTVQAKLVLLGRSAFPERHTWDDYLASHDAHDPVGIKIESIRALEAAGADVLILQANVADSGRLQWVIKQVQARFGAVHGVLHAAGIAGEKTVKLLPEIDRAECERHFEAKVQGTYALKRALQGIDYDFVLLFSSNVSVLGGLGATAYAAANLFMDAFVSSAHVAGQRWISANWDGWLADETAALSAGLQTSIDQYAMQPSESVEAFRRLVTMATSEQVVVSTGHLPTRLDLWINRLASEDTDEPPRHSRPDLETEYVPPENELQKQIVTIWQDLLGIDELGIHDNFFDLGGNSLIGLKVLSRLKKELGIKLPVVSLFEGPTAAALAQLIGQSENGQETYQRSLDRGARRRERHRRR